MSETVLKIRRIDTRRRDAQAKLAELREALSPRGDVVSEAGRQRTIEAFGEPLTPIEVVERSCRDVRERGIEAVLDYSAKLDQAQLTPDELRVSPEEFATAHASADAEFLAAVRRIRGNILTFQRAILHHDVQIDAPRSPSAARGCGRCRNAGRR